MNINEMRIYKEINDNVVKGYVNITLNNALCIKGIKIIDTNEKQFISMPSKICNGDYCNIAFPINKETRNILEKEVFLLYQEMIKKGLNIIEKKYDIDNKLVIDGIKVSSVDFSNNMKAIISLVINDEYVLNDIKLLYKNDHYFITMPSHYVNDKYIDYYHPINKETRNHIEKLIIDAYKCIDSKITRFTNKNKKDIYSSTILDFVYQ